MSKLRGSIITKIIFLILLLVMPLSIMLVYVTYDSMNIMEKHETGAIENTLNIFMTQLDRDMNSMDGYLSRMGKDTFFLQAIQRKEENHYKLAIYNLYREFGEQIIINPRMVALFYYKQGQDILLNVKKEFLPEKSSLKNSLEEITQSRKKRWQIIEVEGKKFLVDIMKHEDAYLGGMISIDDILGEIEDAFQYENMQVFLEYTPMEPDKNSLTVSSKSKLYGVDLTLSMILPQKELTENLPIIQKRNYYMSLMLLLVTPLILVILKRMLLVPLQRLNTAMEIVKKEQTDYRIMEYRTSYEFQNINHTFNSMMDQIKYLKIDNYERELEKNKIELQNLQLQLRPHFLLNSFNLLFNLAQMRDYEKIQKMILCLVSYYRESIRGDKEFRKVKDEITFVENYLELTQMRYKDSFEIHMDVDKDIWEEMIPTLLVYTFVENIIAHGLKLGEKISIKICIFREEAKIVMIVSDNGNGIPEEILREINNGNIVFKDEEEHIGLWNCRKRLHYQYGEEATMNVESKYREGTKIVVAIPEKIKNDGKKE